MAIPDPDVPLGGAPDADTVDIEDEEVPLAGIMSMAQLLEELRVREEIADVGSSGSVGSEGSSGSVGSVGSTGMGSHLAVSMILPFTVSGSSRFQPAKV